tara:strand:+ start:214 stop:1161 length:948 start_codon:yes stop_codon:yes gene_type:complete
MNKIESTRDQLHESLNILESNNNKKVIMTQELYDCKKQLDQYQTENSTKNFTIIHDLKSKINSLQIKINILKLQLKDSDTEQNILKLQNEKCIDKAKEELESSNIIEKNENCLKQLEEKMTEQTGGNILNSYKDYIEHKISGGIIPQLKQKYNILLENEYKTLNSYYNTPNTPNTTQQQKGGSIVVGMVIVIIKIFLFTIGTFIFNWWPLVLLISIYCAYIEYKLLTVTNNSLLGLNALYIILALCCPCIWATFRLFKGWTTPTETQTDGLWHILLNCGVNKFVDLDINTFNNEMCENNGDCFIMPNKCYQSIMK